MRNQIKFNNTATVIFLAIAKYRFKALSYLTCVTLLVVVSGCEKLVEVDFPKTSVAAGDVFKDQYGTEAAVAGMYGIYGGTGGTSYSYGISLASALQADDLTYGNTTIAYEQFKNNSLLPSEDNVATTWALSYSGIYQANAIIEGVTASTTLTASVKNQALGEALFMRAFCYFYMVNLYGDVPLITTTSLQENQFKPRTPAAEVWNQIIADLERAQSILPTTFVNAGRSRANKYAALALLARVYLYQKNYVKAEEKASEIIAESGLGKTFNLPTDLSTVFLITSPETIFSFDTALNGYPLIAAQTVPTSATVAPNYAILPDLFLAFEAGDKRKTAWIGVAASQNYPLKYRTRTNLKTENEVVLRLSEQYLIRAEARAQQGNLSGAQSDFNAVHNRAVSTSVTLTAANYMSVILRERRVELFTEWAHRWLDLRRTGTVDAVIGTLKPAFWQSTDVLYPIPFVEITKNSTLKQNLGYIN